MDYPTDGMSGLYPIGYRVGGIRATRPQESVMLTEEQIASERAIYEERLAELATVPAPPPDRGMSLQLLVDGRAQHMGTGNAPYLVHHIDQRHIVLRAGAGRHTVLKVYAITRRGRLETRGVTTLSVAFVTLFPLARRRWTGGSPRGRGGKPSGGCASSKPRPRATSTG